MSEVLHANIFFLITGISVIIFTALLCIATFHVIKILKSIRRILLRVEKGTEALHEDVQHMRDELISGGILRMIKSLIFGASQKEETHEEPASDRKGTKERRSSRLKIK